VALEELERRIALVRHGRSTHAHAGWIDAAGFREWRRRYEAAGIGETERVPSEIAELAARAELVVSSDAPRAVASARLLAPDREVVVSPLLRELDLAAPDLRGLRLPLLAWAFAVGGRALLLSLVGRYPAVPEAARIESAAAWLEGLAARHARIVAVTHASFRRRLGDRLVAAGWQAEPGRRSVRHWSAWTLRWSGDAGSA